MPVGRRRAASAPTSRIGKAVFWSLAMLLAARLDPAAAGSRRSTSVLQAPHAGQRPSHFGESSPHSVQTKTVFALALVIFQGVLGGLTVIYRLPTLISWALARYPLEHRGRGMGFWGAAFFLGQFLNPPVMTAIAHGRLGFMQSTGVLGLAWQSAPARSRHQQSD